MKYKCLGFKIFFFLDTANKSQTSSIKQQYTPFSYIVSVISFSLFSARNRVVGLITSNPENVESVWKHYSAFDSLISLIIGKQKDFYLVPMDLNSACIVANKHNHSMKWTYYLHSLHGIKIDLFDSNINKLIKIARKKKKKIKVVIVDDH